MPIEDLFTVLPRMREWIEIPESFSISFALSVLPRMREWIEIPDNSVKLSDYIVLPRMREWIEIRGAPARSHLVPRSPSYEGVD